MYDKPCRYFLNGYCSHGSNCRFSHATADTGTNKYDRPTTDRTSTKSPTEQVRELLTGTKWRGVMHKYTGVAEQGGKLVFEGVDLSPEEVRWEYYQRPREQWPQLEAEMLGKVESVRLQFLQNTGSAGKFDSATSAFPTAAVQSSPFGTAASPFSFASTPQSLGFSSPMAPQASSATPLALPGPPQASPFGAVGPGSTFGQSSSPWSTLGSQTLGGIPGLGGSATGGSSSAGFFGGSGFPGLQVGGFASTPFAAPAPEISSSVELQPLDREAFSSPTFQFGKVPEVPPPAEFR